MPVTLEGHDTGNYLVGKGIVTWLPEGSTDPAIDLGNVTELEFSPTIERLDHFSSREGVRKKDLSVVLEKGGTLRIVTDEWTPHNLALFLLGTRNNAAVGGPEIEIFSENAISGKIVYTGTNEIGPKWTFTFNKVQFIPSGSINPISDEWGTMELSGEVLAGDDGKFGVAKLTNYVAPGP